jgi:CRISPR/Cas system CSM-associated protein Csm2 small subunit
VYLRTIFKTADFRRSLATSKSLLRKVNEGMEMASIPKKVTERLVAGIKKYQPILAAAKARDVGEADTVTIIKDMLADVFGYDKYLEVSSEFSIRGTY